jgi:hypothetical protein
MRSTLISAISATRFCSMLMRDSTRRWRSFAAWYSAFLAQVAELARRA